MAATFKAVGEVITKPDYAAQSRIVADGDIRDVRKLDASRFGVFGGMTPQAAKQARTAQKSARTKIANALRAMDAAKPPPPRPPRKPKAPDTEPEPEPASGVLSLGEDDSIAYWWDCDPANPGRCRLVLYKTDFSIHDPDGEHACVISDRCIKLDDGKLRFETEDAKLVPFADDGMITMDAGVVVPTGLSSEIRRDRMELDGSALLSAAPKGVIPKSDELREKERDAKRKQD